MRAAVTLTFCLAATAFSGEPRPSAGHKGWEQLKLSETTIAGTRVCYEKALEPNLPALARELAKLAAGREKSADIVTRRWEIVADINRILGVTDPKPDSQAQMFVQLAGMLSKTKLTFYLATTTTIKDLLRRGGQLPSFSYDRQSDTVTYSPRLRVVPGAEAPETYDVCIPIAPGKAFEQQIPLVQEFGQFLGAGTPEIAIHEITEMTLLQKARPTDPYWRWFSDGFANAITCLLLETHMGREAAQEFARAYDPNECKALAQQINLRYWMLGNYGVYVSEIPVEAESQIQHARYTYALLEAQRLIRTHGIDCLRQILDRVAAQDQRGGADLVQAIRDVTGDDVEPRVLAYQEFAGVQEGRAKYAAACKAAAARQDDASLFVNLMRLMELRSDVFSQGYLRSFLDGAILLFRLGHEEAADQAMENCLKLFSRDSVKQGREAALEAFVRYALECNRPHKGEKMAEELLAKAPNHVPALVVKMLVSKEDGNEAGAQDCARRVLRLVKTPSATYRAAAKILGVDPNAPADYKETIGPK